MRASPVLLSAALVSWLVWRVAPHRLARVATQLEWRLIVPLTLALVVGLYLWDGVCLRWLFAQPQGRVTRSRFMRVVRPTWREQSTTGSVKACSHG
jgi:hypothetical protein